jgi:predicted nucleic-acid-binding protein
VAAIDTNVLVRLVTRDDPAQAAKAQTFIREHQPVLVTQLSVLELAWVLSGSYGFTKEKVCAVVDMLLDMAELDIQEPAILQAAVRAWATAKADFADCYILETVKSAAATPLATFDAALARLPGCRKL